MLRRGIDGPLCQSENASLDIVLVAKQRIVFEVIGLGCAGFVLSQSPSDVLQC